MLTKLLDFVIGREPVATATGIAAVITAALGVGAAFGLPVTAEQIGAIGALAAALAGWAGRRAVTPVRSPADRKLARLVDRQGSAPIALIIVITIGLIVMGGLTVCGDAAFDDRDEKDDLGAPTTVLVPSSGGGRRGA